MPRLWHSKTPPPIVVCPRCSCLFVKRSPRQKFCTPFCQGKDAEKRRPKRIWGKPEYYERKELEKKGYRRCKECNGVFPITDYWSEGENRNSRCKTCAAKKQNRTRKPDLNQTGNRRRAKKWRETHPDVFAQRIKDWRHNNLERTTEISRKRRIRKANNGIYKVTMKDLKRLWIRQCGKCYLCHQPIEDKRELDHIFPIKRGGRHAIGNLAWTHPKCNRNKHTKLLVEIRYGGSK